MDESDKTDEQIALLVQSGKIEFFGVLVNRYQKKMGRYAGRLLNNYEDRQDVVQEIFVKTYINIQSFDAKRRFSSWLYRIAHNEIVNVFKKNKGKTFLAFFDLDTFLPQYANNSNAHSEMEKKEMQKVIEVCFSRLDEKYKEPVALYYLEEFSYKEISDIMQIPVATVGVRIKRAKHILKSIFKKEGYHYGT